MFLFPLNGPCWKVTAKFNVRTFPASDTLDPEPFRTHWVFCWLPLPGVIELTGAAPASVNNVKAFAALVYVIEQAFDVVRLALNSTETVVRSDAPAESEN